MNQAHWLRFAVLEHTWKGVHWDLMIESAPGEALRTWALELPIEPNRDLNARALPDHRPVYLSYEGVISNDRGRVRRVDEGYCSIVSESPDRIDLDFRGTQLAGPASLRRSVVGGEGAKSPAGWVFRLGKLS